MSWQLASLSVAISAHESGRHLARHADPDAPFFVLNDTAWELVHKLEMTEAQHYLINRANKGFNGAMIVLMAEQEGLSIPNSEGHLPFHQSASDDTNLDIDRPNLDYFSYVDRLIPFAASLGITLWLVPTWGRYITGGLQGGPIVFDEQNARSYGRFLGHRYPFHPWIVGGDTNRYWNPDTVACLDRGEDVTKLQVIDYEPIFTAMVDGLKQGERQAIVELDQEVRTKAANYETFITFHSTQGWLPHAPAPSMASAQFPNVDWLTLDCVQSGHCDSPHKVPNWYSTSSYLPVRTMYNTLRPDGKLRPVIDLEGHYESTHHAFDPARPVWGGSDIRNGAYQAIFAGSCGYVYGVNSIWRMWDPSRAGWPPGTSVLDSATAEWFLELDLPGAYYAAILKRIMLDLPNFHARRPNSSFIQSDIKDSHDGSPAGSELISGMSALGWAMVHLPFGGSVTINLVLALPDAVEFRAWWIDPRVGSKVIGVHKEPVAASRNFIAPSEGSINDDWLLYLERTSPASEA